MAVAPDGVIEALYRPASHFLWAVQWHPEFLYKVDPRSQTIFDAFVGVADNNKKAAPVSRNSPFSAVAVSRLI